MSTQHLTFCSYVYAHHQGQIDWCEVLALFELAVTNHKTHIRLPLETLANLKHQVEYDPKCIHHSASPKRCGVWDFEAFRQRYFWVHVRQTVVKSIPKMLFNMSGNQSFCLVRTDDKGWQQFMRHNQIWEVHRVLETKQNKKLSVSGR